MQVGSDCFPSQPSHVLCPGIISSNSNHFTARQAIVLVTRQGVLFTIKQAAVYRTELLRILGRQVCLQTSCLRLISLRQLQET